MIKIPLNEYERLIRENEKLRRSEEYLKNRIDRTISYVVKDIQDIKEILKGGDKTESGNQS